MQRPRRPVARKPDLQPTLQDRISIASSATAIAIPEVEAKVPGSGSKSGLHEALVRELDVAMDGRADLDASDREALREQFKQSTSTVDQNANTLPDSTAWLETVELMREMGAVEEDEVNHLVRQLNAALEPLQSREVQLAMEFSRRMEADGESEALEWFRLEYEKAEADRASLPIADLSRQDQVRRPLRNEPNRSRSMRSRAPPAPDG